ncbi:hypothetical protein B0H14DRAFT_2767597, partial [Mycena olivaceomarginata]
MYFLYLCTHPILYASLMPIHDILPYIAPPWLASLVLPTVVVDVSLPFLILAVALAVYFLRARCVHGPLSLFGHFYISRCL